MESLSAGNGQWGQGDHCLLYTSAARAGATYVSPFLGRLDDISTDGVELIRQIVQIFDVAGLDTEIICASVRHPMHVTECALAGGHIATVPYKVLEQMTHHPLTDAGIEKFQQDYSRLLYTSRCV